MVPHTRSQVARRIDELVNRWHDTPGEKPPLHEVLQMTRPQYSRWVSTLDLPEGYRVPPLTEPELRCLECNGPNIRWWADHACWRDVYGHLDPDSTPPNGAVCPTCFVAAAEKSAEPQRWILSPAGVAPFEANDPHRSTELAAVDTRARNTPPGPWGWDPQPDGTVLVGTLRPDSPLLDTVLATVHRHPGFDPIAVAGFIAHARTSIPDLVSAHVELDRRRRDMTERAEDAAENLRAQWSMASQARDLSDQLNQELSEAMGRMNILAALLEQSQNVMAAVAELPWWRATGELRQKALETVDLISRKVTEPTRTGEEPRCPNGD